MNKEELSRLAMVIGEDNTEKLGECRVAVFGVGGVGGYICEALVRSGIGHIDIFDNDVVSPSNLNRQIIALHSTIGKKTYCRLKQQSAALSGLPAACCRWKRCSDSDESKR